MTIALKEWHLDIWVILRDGKPFDYEFSRAKAFAEAAEWRKMRPARFWSVCPAEATLSIQVPQ